MSAVGANQSLGAAKYFNQVVDATQAQTIMQSCQAKGFNPTPADFPQSSDPNAVGPSQTAAMTQFATKHGCMPPSDQIYKALQQAVGPDSDAFKFVQQAQQADQQQAGAGAPPTH